MCLEEAETDSFEVLIIFYKFCFFLGQLMEELKYGVLFKNANTVILVKN